MSSIIGTQSEADNLNKTQQTQEAAFLQTLDARNQNTSGVNIDQEMSDLIKIQAAYSAAAKMISSSQKLFDDLLNSFQ
jgi:flagellar hook-associated protein 1 FlgK